jgi:hypothetical protein
LAQPRFRHVQISMAINLEDHQDMPGKEILREEIEKRKFQLVRCDVEPWPNGANSFNTGSMMGVHLVGKFSLFEESPVIDIRYTDWQTSPPADPEAAGAELAAAEQRLRGDLDGPMRQRLGSQDPDYHVRVERVTSPAGVPALQVLITVQGEWQGYLEFESLPAQAAVRLTGLRVKPGYINLRIGSALLRFLIQENPRATTLIWKQPRDDAFLALKALENRGTISEVKRNYWRDEVTAKINRPDSIAHEGSTPSELAAPESKAKRAWRAIRAGTRRFLMSIIQPRWRRLAIADHGLEETIDAYQTDWRREVFVKSGRGRKTFAAQAKYLATFFARDILAGLLGLHVLIIRYGLLPIGWALGKLWRAALGIWGRPGPRAERIAEQARRRLARAPNILDRKALLRRMPFKAGPLSLSAIAEFVKAAQDSPPHSLPTQFRKQVQEMDIIGGSLIASYRWRWGKKATAQDEHLIRFLLDHMTPQEDRWVVRSAITALIHVYPKLFPMFQEEFVRRCTELLRDSTLEVTCSAASWGLQRAESARSIKDLWDILQEARQASWVQAYLVEALAHLLAQHRVNPARLPEIAKLANWLLEWAGRRRTSVAMRVNCLKALVQLGVNTPEMAARLEQIILDGPDGTVKEIALWSLVRMHLSRPKMDTVSALAEFLIRFIKAGPQGRQNVVLNDFARSLLRSFGPWLTDESERNIAARIARTPSPGPPSEPLSIVNFIPVESLAEELSGELTTLYTGKVVQKRH